MIDNSFFYYSTIKYEPRLYCQAKEINNFAMRAAAAEFSARVMVNDPDTEKAAKAIGEHHDAGVKEAEVRRAFARQRRDRGQHHLAHDALVHLGRDDGCR